MRWQKFNFSLTNRVRIRNLSFFACRVLIQITLATILFYVNLGMKLRWLQYIKFLAIVKALAKFRKTCVSPPWWNNLWWDMCSARPWCLYKLNNKWIEKVFLKSFQGCWRWSVQAMMPFISNVQYVSNQTLNCIYLHRSCITSHDRFHLCFHAPILFHCVLHKTSRFFPGHFSWRCAQHGKNINGTRHQCVDN